MTSPERLERRLPELFDELAAARVPDYFDNLLLQTARTSQRPAWSSLERWIPVSEIARPAPLGLPSWRPFFLALAAVLLLAIAVGTALIVGAGHTKVPPPFGPAHNGLVYFSTADGDIKAVDPVTGATRAIVGGPEIDNDPFVFADGQRIGFWRGAAGSATFFVADASGGNVRQVPGPVTDQLPSDISADGRMAIVSADGSRVQIIDLQSFATAQVSLPIAAKSVIWRSTTGQLLVTATNADTTTYSLVNADGSGLHDVATVHSVVGDPRVAPDGSSLVYVTWENEAGKNGVVHLLDLSTAVDRVVLPGQKDEAWENPQYSPDGRELLVEHYAGGGYQLAVVALAGGTAPQLFGGSHLEKTNGAVSQFSPDGTQVLASYLDDGTTWRYDLSTLKGEQVHWTTSTLLAWQRLP